MENKIYEMLGGGVIKGSTPKEIIGALRFSSFNPMSGEEIFMKEMSERCKFYNDAVVRVDTPENFVADLIEYGFLWEAAVPLPSRGQAPYGDSRSECSYPRDGGCDE